MNKNIKQAFLFLLFALLIPTVLFAKTDSVGLLPTECFEYYEFGSVNVEMTSQTRNLVSGTTLDIKGKIINKNNYPIIDGALYVKVFRANEIREKNVNGPYLVDQFFVKEGISLTANGELPIEFSWGIPSYALSGEYTIATFFTSAKKFNLLGLSFTNDIVGDVFHFTVNGENTSLVSLDKESVNINNQPFYFAAYPPRIEEEEAVVTAFLTNDTKVTQSVPVTWKIYVWDGQNEEAYLDKKEEMVTVKPGERKPVSVTINDKSQTVYYVVAETTYKDTSSILDIRFARPEVNSVRINFPSVSTYPLIKGESMKVFSCLHTTIADMEDVNLTLSLLDTKKKEIQSFVYSGVVTEAMMGVVADFVPKKNYQTFTLKASLSAGGVVVDEALMTYDCNSLDPDSCPSSNTLLFVVSAIIALIILALLIVRKNRRSISLVFLALFIFTGAYIFIPPVSVEAKTVTNTRYLPNTINNIAYYGQPYMSPYLYSLSLSSPYVTYQYHMYVKNTETNEVIQPGSTVPVGAEIKLEVERTPEDIYWFATGGLSDSPYGDWGNYSVAPVNVCKAENYLNSVYVGGWRYNYVSLIVDYPTITDNLSTIDKLSCVGDVCTVTSAGQIDLNFIWESTPARFYGGYRTGNNHSATYCTQYGALRAGGWPGVIPTIFLPAVSSSYSFNAVQTNTPPTPPTVTGPTTGLVGASYTFSAVSTDADGDQLQYGFDWDNNGTVDHWTTPLVNSGQSGSSSKIWITDGVKTFQVRARDATGGLSDWAPHSINLSYLAPTTDLKVNGSDGPISINSGNSVDLSWTSENASSCTASNGWTGDKAIPSGSENSGAITSAKTFTLTCQNPAGVSVSDSVTVNLNPAFNYSLSNNSPISIVRGGTGSITVTRNLTVGNTQSVTLAQYSVPSGLTINSISNPTCNPTCSSVVNISVDSGVTVGVKTVRLIATSAGMVGRTVNLNVNVTDPVPVEEFSLACQLGNPTGPYYINQEIPFSVTASTPEGSVLPSSLSYLWEVPSDNPHYSLDLNVSNPKIRFLTIGSKTVTVTVTGGEQSEVCSVGPFQITVSPTTTEL